MARTTKDDLKAQLDALDIAYEPEATFEELKALLPEDKDEGKDKGKDEAPAEPTLDFAANVTKLNRSKAWVAQQAALAGKALPTGAAYVEAVKARYIDLGGLVIGQTVAGKARKPKVVNLADNDED